MIVDLASFDILLINTSGGKDSQAMLDYIAEIARKAGVTDRLVAVHADLGRMEWVGTRELAARQVARYAIPFHTISRQTAAGERQDLLQQIEARGMFPDAARRYCTSDHKRAPVLRLLTALVKAKRVETGRRVRVLNMMGLRAQESKSRALRSPFSFNTSASNGRREVWEYLPIHDWSEEQVWARIKASGVEHHEAYDKGMPRLSCCFCVLASKSALVLSAQHNPELAAEYAAVEAQIGHRFKADVSMAEIIHMAEQTPRMAHAESWAA